MEQPECIFYPGDRPDGALGAGSGRKAVEGSPEVRGGYFAGAGGNGGCTPSSL